MTTITIERGLLEQALAALSAPNYRVFSESSVASKLRAALSAPATTPEQCWCRTCRPITQADNRMVLCPDCGNKRCPKATDHRNACTGSNEPGQPGSSYPTVPATAPEQPAWHDAPTVPGAWVCNYGELSIATVNQPDIDAFDPAYNAGGRWFGPLPEDKP